MEAKFSVISEKSQKAREAFGAELTRIRRSSGLKHLDVAYALDISYGTLWYWLTGRAFPQSLLLLKRLHFLFPETHITLRDVLSHPNISPSKEEWDSFIGKLECFANIGGCVTKNIKLSKTTIDRALGWLDREGKLTWQNKGNTDLVQLKQD